MAKVEDVHKTGQTGNRPRDRIYFEARFDGPPEASDVSEAQKKAGYHPGGYGGPQDVRVVGNTATWWCAASCD